MWWKWILLFICCVHNLMLILADDPVLPVNKVDELSSLASVEMSTATVVTKELISKNTQSKMVNSKSIDSSGIELQKHTEESDSILNDIIEETLEKATENVKSSSLETNHSASKVQNDPEIKQIINEFMETTQRSKQQRTIAKQPRESTAQKSQIRVSESTQIPAKPEAPVLANEVKELPLNEESIEHWSSSSSLPAKPEAPDSIHPPLITSTFRTHEAKISVGIDPNTNETTVESQEANVTSVGSEATKQIPNLVPPSEPTTMPTDSKDSGGMPADSENMPSFKEWTEKRLAEQEKNGGNGPSTASAQGKSSSGLKIRQKNYASSDCGAKIIGTNPEAQGASAVLNSFHDEYMLNPCTAKIWLVIELCEPIQARKLEIANFELFSSSPKDFTVYSSDRYPSRDWMLLGTFEAKEEKTIQSFSLEQRAFHKFLKLELSSHYGSEHYCPVSLIHIYGTSELEVLDTDGDGEVDNFNNHDQDDEGLQDEFLGGRDIQTPNLFGSAKDAVLSIVKKAAEALSRDKETSESQSSDKTNETAKTLESDASLKALQASCITLKRPCFSENKLHLYSYDDPSIVDAVETHLSCNFDSVHSLLHLPTIWDILATCNCALANPVPSEGCSLYESQTSCRYLRSLLGPVKYAALGFLYGLEKGLVYTTHPNGKTYLNCTEANVLIDTHSTSESTITPTVIAIEPALDNSLVSGTGTLSSTTFLGESSLFNLSEINESHSQSVLDSSSEIPTSSSLKEQIHPTKTLKPDKLVEKNLSSSEESEKLEESKKGEPHHQYESSEKDVLTDSSRSTTEGTQQSIPTSVLESSLMLSEESSPTSRIDDPALQSPIVDSVVLSSEKSASVQVTSCSSDHTLASDGVYMDLSEAGVAPVSQGSSSSSGTSSSSGANKTNLPPAVQKESIFVRLSNRIKALELNMSLSSQYLEELSQRYRKQMEEMQKAFNKTIAALNETAAKAYEQDLKQQESINTLHTQIDDLIKVVAALKNERENFSLEVIERHALLIFIELLIAVVVFVMCKRRTVAPLQSPRKATDASSCVVNVGNVEFAVDQMLARRRNSFAGASDYGAVLTSSKRTASDETLNKSGVHTDLMIVEPMIPIMMDQPVQKNESKKKKQKHKKGARDLKHSLSNQNLSLNGQQQSQQQQQQQQQQDQSKQLPTARKKNSVTKVSSAGLLFSSQGNSTSDSQNSDTLSQLPAKQSENKGAKNLSSSAATATLRASSNHRQYEIGNNSLMPKPFAQQSLMKQRNGHVCNGDMHAATKDMQEPAARTLFQKLFFK